MDRPPVRLAERIFDFSIFPTQNRQGLMASRKIKNLRQKKYSGAVKWISPRQEIDAEFSPPQEWHAILASKHPRQDSFITPTS
jgi:hypothetical protein